MSASCADIETSSADYATRFSGPAGEWLLTVQARFFFELIEELASSPITLLDVGGGHGQIADAVIKAGLSKLIKVTVLGSDRSCSVQIAKHIASGDCSFQVGNLVELPFNPESFDVVSSFRFIPHCPEWPKLIASMCRVAKKGIIVDYPTSQSINALTPMLFGWKKKLEGNTRDYDLFRHHEIADEFVKNGFSKLTRRGEFFLPMVVHRKLGNPVISEILEMPFRMSGMTNLFGSPVILRALKSRNI